MKNPKEGKRLVIDLAAPLTLPMLAGKAVPALPALQSVYRNRSRYTFILPENQTGNNKYATVTISV